MVQSVGRRSRADLGEHTADILGPSSDHPGEELDGHDHARSYRTFPPTIVMSTFIVRSFSGEVDSRSSGSTTRSASLPTSIEPFSFSSRVRKAPLRVYIVIASFMLTASSGP